MRCNPPGKAQGESGDNAYAPLDRPMNYAKIYRAKGARSFCYLMFTLISLSFCRLFFFPSLFFLRATTFDILSDLTKKKKKKNRITKAVKPRTNMPSNLLFM